MSKVLTKHYRIAKVMIVWQMIFTYMLVAFGMFAMARRAQEAEGFDYATHPAIRPELRLIKGGTEFEVEIDSRKVA